VQEATMAERTFEAWQEENIEGLFLIAADKAAEGQQAEEMAKRLAAFISGAKFNIHIAIYDFRLISATATPVLTAIRAKDQAGLTIRVAYHQERPRAHLTQQDFAHTGGDPAPPGTEEFLKALDGTGIERKAINGHGHLMHSKYVIRDAMTPEAAVWMGSANFTDGAWSLQENNVLILNSPDLTQFYETDFWELWTSGSITTTGRNDIGTVEIGQTSVSVLFSPGEGRRIDLDITQRIGAAKQRLMIASMDISSGTILGAINDCIGRPGLSVDGIFDQTQMKGVLNDWERSGSQQSLAKKQLFEAIAPHFHSKKSTPYAPDKPHDYMHNKLAVVDDAVIIGSFNFSNNATNNAENVLVIESKAIADRYATYVAELTQKYPNQGL
jgi:phosphatidylserine/phosphatidylglycerophosphate/cardiolipin synthase-like enzyme